MRIIEQNEVMLESLLPILRSPRSVASAYRDYIRDKTAITAKYVSAIAQAIGTTVESYLVDDEVTGGPVSNALITSPLEDEVDVHEIVDQILADNGLDIDAVLATTQGDFVAMKDLLTSLVNDGIELGASIQGAFFERVIDVQKAIDDVVDAFQTNLVIESTFATISETIEGSYASVTDVYTKLQLAGVELTSNASSMLVNIGDIVGDRTVDIIGKIARINNLVTIGSEDIQETDEVNGLVIPSFENRGFTGISPFLAMINSIDINLSNPIPAVVNAVVATSKVIIGAFKAVGSIISKGWNLAKNYIDDTFVNPIDFQVLDAKSTSHIVDLPVIDHNYSIHRLLALVTPGETEATSTVFRSLLESMPIGSMKSTYTPFGVVNVVKVTSDEIRLIVHVIPSAPIAKEYSMDSDFLSALWPGYFTPDGRVLHGDANDGMDASFNLCFDRFISSTLSYKFEHAGDDDGYYLSAVAASMYRMDLLSTIATLVVGYNFFNRSHWKDRSYQSMYEEIVGGGRTVPVEYALGIGASVWSSVSNKVLYKDNSAFDNPLYFRALKNELRGNAVSNAHFIEVMSHNLQPSLKTAIKFIHMALLNYAPFMEVYFQDNGSVPPFVPSVYEAEYQNPMYTIVSDGKHGEKVSKFFKGVAITALVITAAVIGVRAFVKIKRSMRMSRLRLNGLQRNFENMDPGDDRYLDTYRTYNKARKTFNKKNAFLKMVGMGVSHTASSSVLQSGFDVGGLLNSNQDVINLIK